MTKNAMHLPWDEGFQNYYHATFGTNGRYRYTLWRGNRSGGIVTFVGLNPSTADDKEDDATVRRLISFAKDQGYSGFWLVNLYALRSTSPAILRSHVDPVGPTNDEHIRNCVKDSSSVVACWGNNIPKNTIPGQSGGDRVEEVLRLIGEECGKTVKCFDVTKQGQPKHPLYIPSGTPFRYYEAGIR